MRRQTSRMRRQTRRMSGMLVLFAIAFVAVLAPPAWAAEVQGRIKSFDPTLRLILSTLEGVVVGRTVGTGIDGALISGAQPYAAFDAKLKELLRDRACCAQRAELRGVVVEQGVRAPRRCAGRGSAPAPRGPASSTSSSSRPGTYISPATASSIFTSISRSQRCGSFATSGIVLTGADGMPASCSAATISSHRVRGAPRVDLRAAVAAG